MNVNQLGPLGTRQALLGTVVPFPAVVPDDAGPSPSDTAGSVLDAKLSDLDERLTALEQADAAESAPVAVMPDSVA